jgi:hypothetical protein
MSIIFLNLFEKLRKEIDPKGVSIYGASHRAGQLGETVSRGHFENRKVFNQSPFGR